MHSTSGRNRLILILTLFLSILLFTPQIAASSVNEGVFAVTQGTVTSVLLGASIFSYPAGDLNKDGFEDIVLSFQTAGSNAGYVFVIFGTGALINVDLSSGSISSTQGIKITGKSNEMIAGAINYGDINNDQIDDLIISTDSQSRVYVIFGKTTGWADISLTSFSPGPTTGIYITDTTYPGSTSIKPHLGLSLTTLDFNGDGIDDLVIAAPNKYTNQGVVTVLFGSSSFSSYSISLNSDLTSISQGFQIYDTTSSYFGLSVNRRRGDVNNDGIDDLIIGSQYPSCSSSGTCGMVAVIYGTTTPTLTLQVNSLFLSQGVQIFGRSTAIIGNRDSINIVGDLNNDGIDDLAFGAQGFSPAGLTFIVYGKSGGFTGNIDLSSSFNGFKITGNIASGSFGNVITAGDMNSDGLSDLIISAPGPSGTTIGRVYTFFGNKNGFSDIDLSSSGSQLPQVLVVDGDTSSSSLGQAFMTPRDYDEDGVDDVAIFGKTQIFILYGKKCGSPDCSSLSSNPICYTSAGCACGQFSLYFQENVCVTQCSTGYSLNANAPICDLDPVETDTGATPLVVSAAAAVAGAKNSTSIATLTVSFFSFANPGPIVILSLSQVFDALKLMNITYPPRLAYLLQNSGSQATIFTQITDPPNILTDNMNSYSLDEKFEEAGFDSSFLVNFWSDLLYLVGLLALLLLVIFINFCFSPGKIKANTNSKRIAIWLYFKLRQAVKWNLLLSTFTGCYGDISLFTSLQMQTVHFDSGSALEWISFILCVLANIAIFALQILSLKIASKLMTAHHQSQKRKNPKLFERAKRQLEGCEVLFETFKEKSFLQQSFLFLFSIKMYIFWAVISYSPNYPLVPTLLNSIIGLLMILYLIIVRPHKEIIEFINFILAEIIYEIMNICTLLLVLDENDYWDLSDSRVKIGDIIIVCNCIFMVLLAISSVIQILFMIKDLYCFIKEWIRRRNASATDLSSFEEAPLNSNKNQSKPRENLDNSHSLHFDHSMNMSQIHQNQPGSPFERSPGRQTRRNQQLQGSPSLRPSLDDSELILVKPAALAHRSKTIIQNGFENNSRSQTPRMREGKISPQSHKQRLQKTNNEHRNEASDIGSRNTRKISRSPTQPSPTKRIRIRGLENSHR